VAVVRIFRLLGQMLNHFVEYYVILCNVISYLVIVKFYGTVFDWYDIGITYKPQFDFYIFIKGVLNITDTYKAAKNTCYT
jgi:hypothetical protein